jgi:hypothetical protein
MVNHAKKDTIDHFTLTKEGRNGLYKGTIAALKQLGRVTQLPKQDKLWEMTDIDVDIQNEEIPEAMKQYESHTWKDHDNLMWRATKSSFNAFSCRLPAYGLCAAVGLLSWSVISLLSGRCQAGRTLAFVRSGLVHP